MLVKVKAHTRSPKDAIIQKKNDSFDVYVKEKAEGGKANRAVLDALAVYFNISPSKIRLRRGVRKPNKIIEIPDFLVEPRMATSKAKPLRLTE
ncbi:MAG: DUF167 domain-containing protein [bacterium]|nr:DUF167 domain-containing protein [bacterium]